jgi:dCMP deaminase
MLMDMAKVVAQRSTCSRMSVGVIVAAESRPLVSGYNGAPSGMEHCDHTCTCLPDTIRGGEVMEWRAELHERGCPAGDPCKIAVHAEANAIAHAAKNGIPLDLAHLFTTMAPCYPCSQLIINAGIVAVAYSIEYRDVSGLSLLREAGVQVCRLA